MPARLKTFKTPGVKPYRPMALRVRDMTTGERECWMFTDDGREVGRAALVEGNFLLGAFDAEGNFRKILEKSNLPDVHNHFSDTSLALQCLEEGLEALRGFLQEKRKSQIANLNHAPVYTPTPA